MSPRVRLSTLLRQAAGWQEVLEIKEETPVECLQYLEKNFPDMRRWLYDNRGNMWDRLQIYLNGEIIHGGELTKRLDDEDELFILLNIGGG